MMMRSGKVLRMAPTSLARVYAHFLSDRDGDCCRARDRQTLMPKKLAVSAQIAMPVRRFVNLGLMHFWELDAKPPLVPPHFDDDLAPLP